MSQRNPIFSKDLEKAMLLELEKQLPDNSYAQSLFMFAAKLFELLNIEADDAELISKQYIKDIGAEKSTVSDALIGLVIYGLEHK